MSVKIRLMRIGARKRPFYRIVAVDERKKRTGGYLELLGTYNPLTTPKEINIKQDLVDSWVKKGAVLSDGYLRIIGKAPQRLPRKPKKEKKLPESSTPTLDATPDMGKGSEEAPKNPAEATGVVSEETQGETQDSPSEETSDEPAENEAAL